MGTELGSLYILTIQNRNQNQALIKKKTMNK